MILRVEGEGVVMKGDRQGKGKGDGEGCEVEGNAGKIGSKLLIITARVIVGLQEENPHHWEGERDERG